ncbi:ATP-binding protein, partial [Streptomyces sp. SID625]|nr:ATP-binding protein [Streptomyces sp. SID625]
MRFTSTPRGARLARRLAAVRPHAWDIPYGTDAHDAIVRIVAEPAANAVRHGHVPGRD